MPVQDSDADQWSRTISEIAKTAFASEDIYHTMRFSDLRLEEMFPATMSFGNSRMFLFTGITQCQRMAEALEKYKTAGYEVSKMSEDDKRLMPSETARYEPSQVEDFLKKWKKYDLTKEPYDKLNLPVIFNELSAYNQNLMWWSMAWEPIQRAHYNLLYAVNSRTFKGLIDLGKNQYQRETEVKTAERRHWPWSKKKEEE